MDVDVTLYVKADDYNLALAEIECLRAELNQAQTRLCKWTHEDDDNCIWEGECGCVWEFMDDGPVENEVKYCPKCGGIVVVEDGEI